MDSSSEIKSPPFHSFLFWGIGIMLLVGIVEVSSFFFLSSSSHSAPSDSLSLGGTGPQGEEIAPLIETTLPPTTHSENDSLFNYTTSGNNSLSPVSSTQQVTNGGVLGPHGEQVAPVIQTTPPPATNSSQNLPVSSSSSSSSGSGPQGEEIAPVIQTTPPPTNYSESDLGVPQI